MRIISGTAKGTKLYTLDGISTRPTLDRVKEPLFSIIQAKINNECCVLDLFSGSGALGLEALSRGAKKAYLCDKSYEAINIIKKNIEKTHLQEKAIILNKDYKKSIEFLKENKFDLIFIDPPYKLDIAVKAVKQIIELGILAKNGLIIVETDDEKRELKELENINVSVKDLRTYGRVKLLFLNRKE